MFEKKACPEWINTLLSMHFIYVLAPIDQSGSVFKEGTLLIFLYPCSPNCAAPYFEVIYAYHALSKFGTVEHSVVTSAGCPGCVYKDGGLNSLWGSVYWGILCVYWGAQGLGTHTHTGMCIPWHSEVCLVLRLLCTGVYQCVLRCSEMH